MADDSIEIIEPLDFQPCSTPRGCTYYDPKILTDCQQLRLNEMKLAVIKSDEKYLRTHPEIRAFVALITRYVFKHHPRRDIPTLIKAFFDRPREQIEDELEAYMSSRPPQPPEVEFEEEESEEPFADDYRKYLDSLVSAAVEEEHPLPPKEINSEAFIKQLLVDRIRQFPSAGNLPPVKTSSRTETDELEVNDLFTPKSKPKSTVSILNLERTAMKPSDISFTANVKTMSREMAGRHQAAETRRLTIDEKKHVQPAAPKDNKTRTGGQVEELNETTSSNQQKTV